MSVNNDWTSVLLNTSSGSGVGFSLGNNDHEAPRKKTQEEVLNANSIMYAAFGHTAQASSGLK